MTRRMSGKITEELGIREMTSGLKRDARKKTVKILISYATYNTVEIREMFELSQVDSARRPPKMV